ncbi:1-aminocyclopropane-1-carboxylate synthase-like protein 1 [Rhinatrema bivittatum]|uniref:1-aminocyclopropane-1-carboxylate synthase-like protein 1 n=1 Tax=Rhinatrema bivittatum TaxID=194408 RepID=UPI001129C8D0|nr:1-aminocyclopropane-1-carboxylate synthase-like protein 1 [Rhinatrema bivittatum]
MCSSGSHLSARGTRIAGEPGGSTVIKGFAMYLQDPFHRHRNPQGILNFGTSENNLCFDLLRERITRPGMNCMASHLLQYSDTRGIKRFREAIANFLTTYGKAAVPVNPEHIVVMNGCSSIFASLLTVLCDPGDGYLIPTPYYGCINSHTGLYGETQPVHVPLFSEVTDGEMHPFQLTVEKLEAAMQRAMEQDIRVRALILINPHNPLGDIYPAHLLKECLEFAYRYKLHVVMDEIYMLSVYGEDAVFTSILTLDDLPDPERTHLMWGFSKDFAMSGIRVGVLHTKNQEILTAVGRLALFHGCPGPIQYVLNQLLNDRDWLDNEYFPINKRRLQEAHSLLVGGLTELGIPVLRSLGGLYVWADFRKFLTSLTVEVELALWWKLIEEKLYISPGSAFYCYELGWFRLVFSNSKDKINLCLQRLQKVLERAVCEPLQSKMPNTFNELQLSSPECESLDSDVDAPHEVVTETRLHLEKINVY